MDKYLLETKNLTKEFGKFKAVNDVNLHIKRGAIYGFIGRNGAGKTTFLKMISSLSAPSSGEIIMFGKKGKEFIQIRDRIGCLIEAPGLYPNMSAYNNLKIKCIALGYNKKSYIDELLCIVGLESVKNKKVKKFSLGMKQRLGIAMALVGEPDLLVLDEPINGLDPQGIAEVRDTILKLKDERNMTVIISSHILEELSKIATDYGIIHNGVLLQELSREELLKKCGERIEIVTDNTQAAVPVLDKLNITNYQVVDSEKVLIFERLDDSAAIGRELIMNNINIKELSVTKEELESYFLNMTGGAQHA